MKFISSLFSQKLPIRRSKSVDLDNFQKIMNNNKTWATKMIEEDPNYFK